MSSALRRTNRTGPGAFHQQQCWVRGGGGVGTTALPPLEAIRVWPVRYLATLVRAGEQDVVRWFILVVALLMEPAAVLLLLAVSSARK